MLRSVGRRDLSAGPEQKKNTLGGVFFFAAAPRGRSLTHCGPGWRCLPLAGVAFVFLLRGGAGPGWCFFFCCGPARTLTHSLWAGAISARPGWCFFFWLRPRRLFLDNNKKCLGYYIGSKKTRRGHSKKKKHHFQGFFFALAPCPTGLLLLLPFPGPEQKKNTLGGVFFLLWPRAGFQRGFSFPCLSPGPQQKKTPWVVFFFLLAPWPRFSDAHSLTVGLGGDASPSPGWRLFFCCVAGPDRGGVFFFCCGPARTLTHSLWAGAISARPGWCFFFLLRPRRVFLDNNKKCLGYYIGSIKDPAGPQQKKKHHFQGFFFALAPCPTGLLLPLPFPGPEQKKKNTLGGVFFCSGPVPASNGASPSLAFRRGRSKKKKKTPWVVFFFLLWPRAGAQRGFSFPCLSPGPEQKKNTLGVVFFAAAPRGRSLTHCGPGWRCLPLGGVVFFFLLRPRPDRGGVFFFAVAPPGRSLTHCGLGRFRQGPGGVFCFAAAPPGLFRQ